MHDNNPDDTNERKANVLLTLSKANSSFIPKLSNASQHDDNANDTN